MHDNIPIRIEVDDRTKVTLTWQDGSTTELSAAVLRAACQCAACREPAGMEQTKLVLSGPVPVTIEEAALVGGYAISFVFGPDGHGTGIFPFDNLRELGDQEPSPNI